MPAVGTGIVNIKGGVGNHDLLSTTHPDTTPAAVTRGGIVIGVGVSPKWELVAIGGANTVLHSDGTDATWAALVKADLPSTVVYTDQANVYGDFDQSFRSNRLRIANPTNTFFYSFTAGAIGANQVITLPLLTAGDTMVTEAFAQTITNKSISATNNTITNITNTELATGVFVAITGVGVQTQPLDMNGNDIILDAAGNIRIDNSVVNVTKLKHSTNFPNFGLLRDQLVADGSTAGKISFRSRDDVPNERVFGEIRTIIEDTTVAGNLVHGSLHIRVMDTNVETTYISFNDAKSGQIDVLKKATFNPNATHPGLNFGSQAGDPNTLVNGDAWYNSITNKLRARENGASVDLISGAGGANFLGDGSDGDVTISSNTDLGTDNHKQYKNLTIDAGVTLSGDSPFLVRCTGTLTLNGTIEGNEITATVGGVNGIPGGDGGDGGQSGGVIIIFCNAIAGTGTINADGLVGADGDDGITSGAGIAGGAGNDGINEFSSLAIIGDEINTANDISGNGGGGGTIGGGGGDGGTSGTGSIRAVGQLSIIERIINSIKMLENGWASGSGGAGASSSGSATNRNGGGGGGGSSSGGDVIGATGGAGGSGGSLDGQSGGGGAGAGGTGGYVLLLVKTGDITAITITCDGANGGNGGSGTHATNSGAGGGGAGGAGGTIAIFMATGATDNSTKTVTGGTGGVTGTTGNAGGTGGSGGAGSSSVISLGFL